MPVVFVVPAYEPAPARLDPVKLSAWTAAIAASVGIWATVVYLAAGVF